MDRKRNTRRYLLILVAVVVLFVSAAGVVAFAQSDSGAVFTGCLNQNSGVLRNVAIGYEAAMACNEAELQITWDWAGPAFEGRIAALEERVAELEEPFGTLELFVDCGAGETINDALADAQTHAGPVNITISGVCVENVGIDRDNVRLSGVERTDGIRAAEEATVIMLGASDIRISNMTISGGSAGIEAGQGSSFFAADVTVLNASVWGILVDGGASGSLRDCDVRDSNFGIAASGGGALYVVGCSMTANTWGMMAEGGGTVKAFSVDASGNSINGVVSQGEATIWLNGSTVTDNGQNGINILHNSTAIVGSSTIANNQQAGASAAFGSHVNVFESTIEGNTTDGINATNASSVALSYTTITANGGDGVLLEDQSNGAGDGPGIVITDNGGYGINCAGPAAIKEVQNGFNLATIVFSGNTNGDTNCP